MLLGIIILLRCWSELDDYLNFLETGLSLSIGSLDVFSSHPATMSFPCIKFVTIKSVIIMKRQPCIEQALFQTIHSRLMLDCLLGCSSSLKANQSFRKKLQLPRIRLTKSRLLISYSEHKRAHSIKYVHPDTSAIQCIVILAVQWKVWLIKAIQIPRGIALYLHDCIGGDIPIKCHRRHICILLCGLELSRC